MQVTAAQKQDLYEQGFVKLPGIVPRQLVDNALRVINASLGTRGIDPAQLTTFKVQSYCPELRSDANIAGLLHQSSLSGRATSNQRTMVK
jgi:hypothetical protein